MFSLLLKELIFGFYLLRLWLSFRTKNTSAQEISQTIIQAEILPLNWYDLIMLMINNKNTFWTIMCETLVGGVNDPLHNTMF